MKWSYFLVFVALPARAEIAVFTDGWVDETSFRSSGLEYVVGDELRASAVVAQFRNGHDDRSYYGGLGGSVRLWSSSRWRLTGGAYVLYVKHGERRYEYTPAPYRDGEDMVVALYTVKVHEDFKHQTTAPYVTLAYGSVGLRLMLMEQTEDVRSTFLQMRLSF